MSKIRSFFARLFSWPFFVGLGVGIPLTLGGLFLLSVLFTQMVKNETGALGSAPLMGPDIPERAARSVYGTVPDDWRLRPVSADAEPISFAEIASEKTVVNLWATWCAPCIKEMPTLEALHTSTGDSVSVVLVSEERPETVRQFLSNNEYDMPFYVTSGLPTLFEGRAIPRTYVVDPKSRVLYRHEGIADWNADSVHRLLQQIPESNAGGS